MNICIQVFVRTYIFSFLLDVYLRIGISALYSTCRFKQVRNCQTVFQSGCAILPSHQQGMGAPISLHPHQQTACCGLPFHFFIFLFLFKSFNIVDLQYSVNFRYTVVFNYSHPGRYEVVPLAFITLVSKLFIKSLTKTNSQKQYKKKKKKNPPDTKGLQNLIYLFIYFVFVGLHPWHMEVSRLGVQSKL